MCFVIFVCLGLMHAMMLSQWLWNKFSNWCKVLSMPNVVTWVIFRFCVQVFKYWPHVIFTIIYVCCRNLHITVVHLRFWGKISNDCIVFGMFLTCNRVTLSHISFLCPGFRRQRNNKFEKAPTLPDRTNPLQPLQEVLKPYRFPLNCEYLIISHVLYLTV